MHQSNDAGKTVKIKEFSLRRYGPLPDTGRVVLDNFSLLFGKNEDGKTLTIDGLVKLLFKKNRKSFECIDRVSEDPEGYVIIENGNKEIKLSGKGDLLNIVNLSPQECRNIFVIRNSDLSIAAESEFYTNVTDRLTGLRTQAILSIKSQLQKFGKLTKAESSASLRDWAEEKTKTRVENANKLIEEIETLNREIEREGFDKFDQELFEIKEKVTEITGEIESFEDARKRGKYEEGNRAYGILISAQRDLEALKVYTIEDEKVWTACEQDISNHMKGMERVQSEVDTREKNLKNKEEEAEEKRLTFQAFNERKKRIDDEIKPEIKTYEMKAGKAKLKEKRSKFFAVAAIFSAILLSISMLGVILNPSPLLYALLASFLILTCAFAALRFSFTQEKAWLTAVFERIRLAASRFELAAESIEEIIFNIQKFDEGYSKKQGEKEEAEKEVLVLEEQIKRLKETDIPGIKKQIGEATEKAEGIMRKARVRTLQEYREKLEQKLGYEKAIYNQAGILKSHFGSRGENLQQNLSHWFNEINALKEFESKAKDITYDEKTVSGLKDRRKELLGRMQELESKMVGFHGRLKDIERKANDILKLEDDYLHCNTSVDIKAIKDRVSDFVAKVEKEKENALKAISIFEKLEREEEMKVTALFGEDSPISHHFHKITDGVYEGVEFIPAAKKVQVRLKDTSILGADKLSGAAYDQLYLSIRLALGEQLLKGSKGFFVLDDPFIKSDSERLRRQFDILRELSESGWQIIYFTAKDEVREILKQDIGNGKVRYVELQGIFSK